MSSQTQLQCETLENPYSFLYFIFPPTTLQNESGVYKAVDATGGPIMGHIYKEVVLIKIYSYGGRRLDFAITNRKVTDYGRRRRLMAGSYQSPITVPALSNFALQIQVKVEDQKMWSGGSKTGHISHCTVCQAMKGKFLETYGFCLQQGRPNSSKLHILLQLS